MAYKQINNNLISQLKAGNKLALAKTYMLYSKGIYQLALRFVKEKELSENIVQETFVSLWLSREALDTEGDLWQNIYAIAKQISLRTLRDAYHSANLPDRHTLQRTTIH